MIFLRSGGLERRNGAVVRGTGHATRKWRGKTRATIQINGLGLWDLGD